MDDITPCYSIHWMDDPDGWGRGWYVHCDRCDQPIRDRALPDVEGDIGPNMAPIGRLITQHHRDWHGDEPLPGAEPFVDDEDPVEVAQYRASVAEGGTP
jgi:hypothetical protein